MDDSMDSLQDYGAELSEIKSKIFDMQKDMKVIIEQTNSLHLDTVLKYVRNNYMTGFASYVAEDARSSLEKNMVKKCERRAECTSIFNNFLKKNIDLLRRDELKEDTVESNRAELEKLKTILPYDKCEICYSEVAGLFAKQVNLMQSVKIYDTNKGKQEDISVMSPKQVVNGILEPLCHEKRFEILKSLSVSPQTFSSLSQITDLRGGNLLFHLQKLMEAGIIMQRHERGDYMITAMGFRIMEGVRDIYSALTRQEPEKNPVSSEVQ